LFLKYPIDFFRYNFIQLGLTRAKALQTVRRFARETRRRSAASKSKAFALNVKTGRLTFTHDNALKKLWSLTATFYYTTGAESQFSLFNRPN
jgi:hypothetical protein